MLTTHVNRLTLAWMKATATSSNNRGGNSGGKKKRTTKASHNELVTYEPVYSLEAFLCLRENKEAYTIFVKHFLKPAYSTKWKAKRYEQNTIKRIADILTVSDEAFVLLV